MTCNLSEVRMSTDVELKILKHYRYRQCKNNSSVMLEFLEKMIQLWVVR